MNTVHHWLCGSARWRDHVGLSLLPWVLEGVTPGHDVLEIGPGHGAATEPLLSMVDRLTCVELDGRLAAALGRRFHGRDVTVRHEDATSLSSASGSFDTVVGLTMLHHLPSPAWQDRLFREVARVLRPGGSFVGSDSRDGVILRLLHVGDTLVPVDPATLPSRLRDAGFRDAAVDVRGRWFRFQTVR